MAAHRRLRAAVSGARRRPAATAGTGGAHARDTKALDARRAGSPTPTTAPRTRPDAAFPADDGSPDEALHPRDRGPVRAYVRDVVDSAAGLVGLFVPGFGGTLIAALGPASNLQRWLL
jgi:hypothetical protein